MSQHRYYAIYTHPRHRGTFRFMREFWAENLRHAAEQAEDARDTHEALVTVTLMDRAPDREGGGLTAGQ